MFDLGKRREMLMRWREEKLLQKKLEVMEKAKKKPFRVVHVEQEMVPFCKQEPLPKMSNISLLSKPRAQVRGFFCILFRSTQW